MPPTPPAKPSFNRAGYIATLRATRITETDGLSILLYLAERCNPALQLRKRLYPADHVARKTGTAKITALRRIQRLREQKLLTVVFRSRSAYYQLPSENELQKFS